MNLLSRSCLAKLDKTEVKVAAERGKVTATAQLFGAGTLKFPLNFRPFEVIEVEAVAKMFGGDCSRAVMSAEYFRRGEKFCPEDKGGYLADKDNYLEQKMRFFVPFGADEAYLKLTLEGGASVSFLTLTVNDKNVGPAELCGVADGGLSAYAPKNTSPAVLAAVKAGFKAIVFDVEQSRDGVIVCHDGTNLCSHSDGDGFVEDYDYESLKSLDMGAFANAFYRETRIMTLKEALAVCEEKGITPYFRLHGEKLALEKLKEEIEQTRKGNYYVVADGKRNARKTADVMPEAKIVYFTRNGSLLYGAEEKYLSEAEEIPFADTPDELCSCLKSGAKKIVTGIYLE